MNKKLTGIKSMDRDKIILKIPFIPFMPVNFSLFLVLFLILFVGAFSVFAQDTKKPLEIATIAPLTEDVGSIDGIVKAFYEVVSGGIGVPRQWSRDRTLYIPDIRFVGMSERGGKIVADVMSHQQYVEDSNDFFLKEGFVEKEIKRVTKRFGNMAQIFSTYEFSTSGKNKMSGRGVNSIEMFFDGKRWWISAVTWDEERPNNPIPKEFLP
ncbi:MAG: hypothetical protein WA584_14910 [Pyrinomonadaceae bacterium]